MFDLFDQAFLGSLTPAGPAEPWTPAAITTALWLDAADASTVTTVSGAVSQWNDKSGNSRNATQSSSSSRPAYASVTQNGKNTLTFTGSPRRLDIASTPLFTSGNADLSIFAAYKAKIAASTGGALFANISVNEFGLYVGGSPAYVTPWGIYNGAPVDISSGSYTQNSNYIISCVRSSGSFTGWTFGSKNNTVANTNSIYGGANTESAWKIGASLVNTEPLAMDLWELICINSAPSTDTRQRIEGYLAHKWGETASLPADHPYKSAAPTL